MAADATEDKQMYIIKLDLELRTSLVKIAEIKQQTCYAHDISKWTVNWLHQISFGFLHYIVLHICRK